MIRRAFTLIELLLAVTIGVLIAAAAAFSLRGLVRAEASRPSDANEWVHRASLLLQRDVEQAFEIEVVGDGFRIITAAPIDLVTDTAHSRTIATYQLSRDGGWWIRSAQPERVLSNAKPAVTLLGPSDATLVLSALDSEQTTILMGAADAAVSTSSEDWIPWMTRATFEVSESSTSANTMGTP
ncbi:MAG: prepilin-type N-terminal cleavage/methylation domain-containing protein [Planctomycetota bacterium]